MPTEKRFLKNPKTGQIVRWNPILTKRTDLIPCSPPWEKRTSDAKPNDGYVHVDDDAPVSNPEKPPIVPGMPDPGPDAPDLEQDLAALKKEGEDLVKGWFGRGVANVSKDDLSAFASDKGVDGVEGTKLEMVFQIKEGLKNQGE